MQVREFVSRRELLWNLTLRELRGRYKRSVLGWLWSLLNPLSSMLVFTLVFGVILAVTPPKGDPSGLKVYALYLLAALLPWNFFAGSVASSMGVLVGNAGLIKKVWFPREILIGANVAALAFTFAIELGLLLVALVVAGNMVLPWIPVLVALTVLLALFSTGLGLAFAAVNVYFRDLSHLWGIAAQLWFYATPVIYPITLVPERWRWVYRLNPMAEFAVAYRSVLYDLRFPPLTTVLTLVGVSVAALLFGAFVFDRLSPRFAEEL